MGVGPTLTASFKLNHLFTVCLQLQPHSGVLGMRASKYEQNSPPPPPNIPAHKRDNKKTYIMGYFEDKRNKECEGAQ